MIVDALTLPAETVIETDICIIGAGAAGVTLVREFSNQPYQVCLLESGGLEFDTQTQSLHIGENLGLDYFPLQESRARYLGGSTNLWGGWSRPMDAIDFEDRPWMPYSGWPFSKAELDPYYDRAQVACHLGPFAYELADWETALAQVDCQQLPFLTDQIVTCIWQIIPPCYLRFGAAYRGEIEQAENIKTYLHANVIEIEANDTAQAVNRLRVASSDGKQFFVAAKTFILATGGIENPRLLLASNSVQTTGLGNQHDLVGRFFMEHPYLSVDKSVLTKPANLYTRINFRVGETFMATGIGLSQEVQQREQLLNFCTRLIPVEAEWVLAARRLKKFRYWQSKGHQAFPSLAEGRLYAHDSSVLKDVATAISHLDRLATKAYRKAFQKGTGAVSTPQLCETHLIGEQAPNPDSRITLSRDRDRLGLPRVQLDWQLSPIDKYTFQRSQQIIATKWEQAGLGKLPSELADDDQAWQALRGSYHHIGTTRMSRSPSEGVVNEHCQVHGINNLYVAGSSVFSTSGLSNPTLTIVALAIRLADHLKQQVTGNTVKLTPGREVPATQLVA